LTVDLLLAGHHCGEGAGGATVPIGVDLVDGLLSPEDSDELFGVVKDLDVTELELIIYDGRPETEQFHLVTVAFVFLVGSGEGAPMAPGKTDLGRAAEDLKDLPGEGGKGLVELVVRIFPRNVFGIPEVGGACVEEDVVVSNL
jgi:hypothetical protein